MPLTAYQLAIVISEQLEQAGTYWTAGTIHHDNNAATLGVGGRDGETFKVTVREL